MPYITQQKSPFDIDTASTDWDSWASTLDTEQRAAVDNAFTWSTPETLDTDRKRFLAVGAVAEHLGKDAEEVSENFESFYQPTYAAEILKKPELGTDLGGFHGELVGQRRKVKEAAVMKDEANREATLAAIDGDSPVAALFKWQKQASKKPGYDPKMSEDYMLAYRAHADKMRPYRVEVSQFTEALQREMQGAAKDGDGQTLARFREKLLDMPDDERRLVLTSMWTKAKGMGEEKTGVFGTVQEMGEGLARFVAPMSSNDDERFVERVRTDTALTAIPVITNDEQARQFVQEQADYLMSFEASVEGGGIEGPGPVRTITPEEKALIEKAKARAMQSFQVGREIRQIAQSTDPVGEIAGSVGTSLGIMGAMVLTKGRALPAVSRLYTANNYEQLRLEHPDLSPTNARTIAEVSGAMEAALDLWDIKILTKLPSVSALMRGGFTKAAVGAAARNLGGAFIQEQIQEGAQDLVLPIIKQAFAKDAPSINFDEDISRFLSSRGDVALATIPLILVGGGIATYSDIANSRQEFLTDQRLAEAGYIEKDRNMILDAARTGNAEVIEGAIRDAFTRRMPEVAIEYQEKAGKVADMQAAVSKEMDAEAAAADIAVTRRRDGTWLVTSRDGSVRTTTAEEAQTIRADMMQDGAQGVSEAVNAWLESPAMALSETTFNDSALIEIEGELVRLRASTNEVVGVAASPGEIASVSRQKAALGLTEPQEAAGSNLLRREEIGNAASAIVQAIEVNNAFTQNTIITAIHEALEANFKRGLANGAHDTESTVKALTRLSEALDWSRIETRAKRLSDAAESLTLKQRLDSAISGKADPDAVREIAIELAVMDVMERDRNGGRTGVKAGTFSRALDDLIASEGDMETVSSLGKLRKWMKAVKKWLLGVFGTVKAIQEAKDSGKIKEGDDWTNFVDDLLNLQDSRFAKAVEAEADAMTRTPTAWGNSRAQPADASNVTELPDAQLVGPTSFSLKAYHGTPHKVDKFTTDKIGTGEGAQAYGWGLYFAESEAVGEMYRDTVTAAKREQLGKLQEKLAFWRQFITAAPEGTQTPEQWRDDRTKADSEIAKISQKIAALESAGNLYTVELLPDEADFLDWDKPLSEQSEKVKAALESAGIPNVRAATAKGSQMYQFLGQNTWKTNTVTPQEASQKLASLGIPGIKYLDGNSRDGGIGTRNYVIFDESLVRILEENGQKVEASEGGKSFSLTPASRLALTENRIAVVINQDSEQARKFAGRASERLRRLLSTWIGMPAVMSKAELDLRQKRIVEQRRDELEKVLVGAVESRMGGILAMPELSKVTASPLFQLLQTSGSVRKRYYGWRLKHPSKWRKQQLERNGIIPGDYDAADGLPGMWFQGDEEPDQLAQEAFEAGLISDPSPDALWEGIDRAFSTASKMREQLLSAQEQLKEARKKAKDEAEYEGSAWRFEEDARQDMLKNPRAAAMRDVAALQAVIMAMPPDARKKLPSGLYAKVAAVTSDKGFANVMTQAVRTVDKALNAYWKEKNIIAMNRLVLLGQGKTAPGKKPKGTATPEVHAYFAEVAKVVGLEKERLDGMRQSLESDVAAFAGSEKELEAIQRLQIFDTWSGFNELHVAAQTQVLEDGWALYNAGRNAWRASEEARLEAQRALAAAFVAKVNQGTYERITRADASSRTKKEWFKRFGVETRDFEGVLSALLGREDTITKTWAGMVRDGFARKDDAMRALRKRWQSALDSAMPGVSKSKQRQRLWKMRTQQTIKVTIQEAKATPELTLERRQELLDTNGIPFVDSVVSLTEDQAIFLTMTARQSQYVEPLALAGFTPQVLADIENGITTEGKALRDFMATEYDAGHAGLNAVMERVNGIKLPKIANYSPGRFYNWGNEKPLDVMGTGVVSGGFASGFLIDRKAHFSETKLASALGLFWTHQNESLHWQNMAEAVREMRGVLRNPNVKRALDGAWGDFGNSLFEQWMQAIEGNGIRQAAGAWDKLITQATSNFAIGKLAYNIGTLMKQATATLNTALDVPFGMWVMGAGEVIKHPARFVDVFKADFIQRRLEAGFSPEVRTVLDTFWNSKPGLSQGIMETGMEIIGFTDAFFTSVSAAVAYEAGAKQAEQAGFSPTQAHQLGLEKAEEVVARTAQPSTVDRKSMLELRQNALGRMLMLFMTEARQKAALWGEAWGNVIKGKPTARDGRIIAVSHLLIAPMLQAITSMIKDWRDGPDDGDDDKAWEATDFLIAALLGPIDGIPFVGTAIKDGLAGRTFGGKGSDVLGSPITATIAVAGDLLTDLVDDKDQTAQETIDKLLRFARELGGAPGVGANVVKQVGDTVEQFQ